MSGMQLRKIWKRFAAAAAARLRGFARFTPGLWERKRAGKTGTQSALLQAVLESAPEIIFVKDREGRVITANNAYFASFGRRPEQVLGFEASAFVSDPEFLQLIRQSDQDVISTGRPLHQEFWYQGPDGSRRYFETRLAPLSGQLGRVEGLVGVVLDLTKAKTTEEALRASQKQLETHSSTLTRLYGASSRLWQKHDLREGLDEMLAGAIELSGADMGNIQILDPARAVLEIAAQCGFGQEFLDFFREVSIADDTACGRALRLGERVVIEDVEADCAYTPFRAAARTAGYRAVQSTPIIARDGVPLGMLSTHFRQAHRPPEQSLRLLDLYVRQAADFIERCRGDEALKEKAELARAQFEELEQLYAHAPVGLLMLDRDLRYVRINERLAETNGFPREAHIGRRVHEIVPSLAPAVEAITARILATGRAVLDHEFRGETPKQPGVTRYWNESWYPLRGPSGAITGFGAVVEEITERRRDEEQLQWNARRNELLSMAAARLLESGNPQEITEDLCRATMDFLDCHAFFNHLFNEREGRLRLNACAGIPEEEARRIEGLDLGQGIWGCAAQEHQRIIAENISSSGDPRADLVRSYGIEAYCCHPLMVLGSLIGTLSFGTRSRPAFTAAEIEVMKGIADLIAIAIHRIKVEQELRASKERLTLAQQAGHVGVFDWDTVTNSVTWTPELEKIFGLPVGGFEKNYEGWRKRVHPEDLQRLESLFQAWLRSARDEEQWDYRFYREGEVRWMAARGRALRDNSGRAIRVIGTNLDITERKAADLALRASEERLRLAAQTARFGIHDYDAAADRIVWSPELYAIAGLPAGTAIDNEIMMSTVHPEDRQKVADAIRVALSPAGGGIFDEEFRIVRHDTGETRWVQNRCQTLFSDTPEGRRLIRNVGVAVDITERKKKEEQLELLMREVNHRAKNLLAVVQSMAYQTAKSAAGGDFAAIFQERLAGLAACQEVLVASEWKGVSLAGLIHAQVSHFGALKDQRLFLQGPVLAVTPSAAQTLGMAFHELGTNAVKYGALSNESGTVHITWDVIRAPEPRFRLTWIERGGPPPVQPHRRGFGTTVLTEMAELGLDAKVLLDFPPAGLMWQITAPAALVLDGRAQPSFDA